MNSGVHRTLLLSLPWADFAFPSIKIGALAAYASSRGHAVDARHAHLEAAAVIGLKRYAAILNERLGEGFSACLLFPHRAPRILPGLAASPREARATVQHLRKALRKIYEEIPWCRYRLAGFTVDLDQIFASLLMAQWIKEDHPRIKVLFGGQCASDHLGAAILRCFPQVDWCISGEGEIPFTSLMDHLASGTTGFEPKIPSLVYRTEEGIHTNPRAQLTSLAQLPDPDFDHYFETLERHPLLSGKTIDSSISIEGGRGCTHRCAFCGLNSFMHGYRRRPPKEIAAQMERLSRRYRTARFHFTDLRTQPESDAALFQEIARQGRDYGIYYQFRADTDKQLLTRMRLAGVSEGQIGIEALSSSLLSKMNKQTRFIDNLQALKFCTELGIDHYSNLILGFPTETQKDIDESIRNIDYALAYRPPVRHCRFVLMDGSLVHAHPERFGVVRASNGRFFASLLPAALRDTMLFLEKSHRRRHRSPKYTKLLERHHDWAARYAASRKEGTMLLRYFDCSDFLRIEDRRAEELDITLDGAIREVYLFCDSIRSFKEIRKRFPKVPEKELRRALRRLFQLKIMYTEDDDWLSLAIHASPENRRHMPFL